MKHSKAYYEWLDSYKKKKKPIIIEDTIAPVDYSFIDKYKEEKDIEEASKKKKKRKTRKQLEEELIEEKKHEINADYYSGCSTSTYY